MRPEDSVRAKDWVNAFDQGYGKVQSGLGPFLDGGPNPFGEDGCRLVRVGVGTANLQGPRESVNLIVTLNVVGSMSADSRIGVTRKLICRRPTMEGLRVGRFRGGPSGTHRRHIRRGGTPCRRP